MKIIIVDVNEECIGKATLTDTPRKGDYIQVGSTEFEVLKVVWNYQENPNLVKIKIDVK